MLRLSDNPPLLSPQASRPGEMRGRGHWFVAHTKARCEKVFAFDLLQRGIGFFLPMAQRLTISGGRRRTALLPLFRSYVFFCGNEEDRYRALLTGRLCQVIEVGDQHRLSGELDALYRVLVENAQPQTCPFAALGRRYRVRAGPFKDLEGTVIDRNGLTSLVLQITILGQAVAIDIDSDLLDPLDEWPVSRPLAHAQCIGMAGA